MSDAVSAAIPTIVVTPDPPERPPIPLPVPPIPPRNVPPADDGGVWVPPIYGGAPKLGPGGPAPPRQEPPPADIYTPPPPPQAEPDPSPGFLQTAWDTLKGAGGAAVRAVTGEGRTEFPDVPNLFHPGIAQEKPELVKSPAWGRFMLGTLAGGGDDLAPILREYDPDAVFYPDKFGNRLVKFSTGQDYYLDKPGLSAQRAMSGAAQAGIGAAALALPGGVGVLAARGALPLIGTVATEGAIGAGLEVGRQLAARGLGSEGAGTKADVALAGIGAALGAPLGRVATNLWERFGGSGRIIAPGKLEGKPRSTPVTEDMLTETGKQVLEGFDLRQFTVGQLLDINDTVGRAARQVAASKAPPGGGPSPRERAVTFGREGYPATRGELLGSGPQLAAERTLQRSAGTEREMLAFRETQQQALEAMLARRLGIPPGQAVPPEMQYGLEIGRRLLTKGETFEKAAEAAWNALGPIRRDTLVFQPSVSDAIHAATVGNRDLNDRVLQTMGHARQARRMIDDITRARMPDGQVLTLQHTLLKYRNIRRDLQALYEQAGSKSEKDIIAEYKRRIDDVVNQHGAAAVIKGDPAAIDAFRVARTESRQEFNFWGPDNPVAQKFMERIKENRSDLTGQQVFNAIFGEGHITAAGRTPEILRHLEAQFPKTDPLWDTVRGAAYRRTLLGANDAALTPKAIDTRIGKLLEGNGQEIALRLGLDVKMLQELQRDLRVLQESSTRNPSNTSHELANILRGWASRYPLLKNLFGGDAANAAQINRALGPDRRGARLVPSDFPPPTRMPQTAGAVAGAVLGPRAGGLLFNDWDRR